MSFPVVENINKVDNYCTMLALLYNLGQTERDRETELIPMKHIL